MAFFEHVNVTVEDPDATAAELIELFGWHVRWSGGAKGTGHSVHVGNETSYIALYTGPDGDAQAAADTSYRQRAGLNHIGIVVEKLDDIEAAVKAKGYETHSHAAYEPGRRFYYTGHGDLEIEVVQYD